VAKVRSRQDELLILEAFSSLIKADTISIHDTGKLFELVNYYVDQLNLIPRVLQPQDHIVVGRRGTGKTTLLYRAFGECLRSWDPEYYINEERCMTQDRVLPVYVDLRGCTDITKEGLDEEALEAAFLHEIARNLADQVTRLWPKPDGLVQKLGALFGKSTPAKVHEAVGALAATLLSGTPLFTKTKKVERQYEAEKVSKIDINLSTRPAAALGLESKHKTGGKESFDQTLAFTAGDFMARLHEVKQAADLTAIMIFVDEFSALEPIRQRRIARVLKPLLGNKLGIFFKISAITDRFDVGDILIPRDLNLISLDVDAMLGNATSLPDGMNMLTDMLRNILAQRLTVLTAGRASIETVFEDPESSLQDLARAGMGVTRTVGHVLERAWTAAMTRDGRLNKNDVLFGVKTVGNMYLDRFLGSVRGGGLPPYQGALWGRLINRAQRERQKVTGRGSGQKSEEKAASHFHVLPKYERYLAKALEFYLVHLVVRARSTKKDRTIRHLYCFDYGLCNEYSLGFSTHKDTVRQERFIYDDELSPFDDDFVSKNEVLFICKSCQVSYKRDDLYMERLSRYSKVCPDCGGTLEEHRAAATSEDYTEEEAKIIGAIYACIGEGKLAREIADEVGCLAHKVSNFGKRLRRLGKIVTVRDPKENRLRYRPVS
jgi:hypothetical protein